MAAIDFEPALPVRKAEALHMGHLGSSLKLWIKARSVARGNIATGGGAGLQWMFSDGLPSTAPR